MCSSSSRNLRAAATTTTINSKVFRVLRPIERNTHIENDDDGEYKDIEKPCKPSQKLEQPHVLLQTPAQLLGCAGGLNQRDLRCSESSRLLGTFRG